MPQQSVRVTKDINEFGNDSAEAKRLRTKHQLYSLYMAHWDLCLGAYEGGPEFANEHNIFRHFRENEDDFRDRTRRIHYVNYCEQIVDFYSNFIFSETIDRNGGNNAAYYDEFIKNVDNKGTDLNTYMKRVSDETQIFGMCYTLVDAPPVEPDTQMTKQQEKDMGIRPYWVFIRPDEVVDWVIDDFENFTYLKRCEITSRVEADNTIHMFERYTEMYLDHYTQTEIDITDPTKPQVGPPKTTPNTLGKVPVYVHRYKRSRRYPFMGNSFLRDFAYNNREIMNLTSLLQEFLYRQCFNILAKEVESQIPLTSQQDGIVGNANVLEYPKGAKAPAYLSPPAEPAKFIQEERATIKEEMFRRASQDYMQELSNGQGASGYSKTQSFSKTVPFIATRAESLELAENALMTLTFERISKVWDGRVKYKDHYEITNLTDAMTQYLMMTRDMLMPSETFDKEELKRFVNEFDGKFSQEVRAKIGKEIDAMDYEGWKKIQEQALIGSPKSPAEQQKPKDSGTVIESQAEAKAGSGAGAATRKIRQ